MATITSKGQITIPKEIRDALGLYPGTRVEFELQDGKLILRKRVPREAFDEWEGSLRGKVPFERTDDLMNELRGEVGKDLPPP